MSLVISEMSSNKSHYMKDIEVVSIFPKEDLSSKNEKAYRAKGTCHVKMNPLGLHVKNVSYRIDHEGKTSVRPPF